MTLHLERQAAERFNREMARREAKNFYWGFISLPREQRTAIYALYNYGRILDDAQASERHGIPERELAMLIDGVEMDANRKRYADWEELRGYCYLVASVVGRMCVRVFGFTDAAALKCADDLGLALQLTNLLRDITEDACATSRGGRPRAFERWPASTRASSLRSSVIRGCPSGSVRRWPRPKNYPSWFDRGLLRSCRALKRSMATSPRSASRTAARRDSTARVPMRSTRWRALGKATS